MERIIVLNDVEPAALSFRHPLGIDLDLRVTMQRQNGTGVDPSYAQFVMLPRSRGGVYPYDMTAFDIVNGVAQVEVPGSQMTDPWGYNIELYTRRLNDVEGDPPLPTGLVAKGVIITEGSSYMSSGPLGMVNIPVVTGPTGPQGETGARGSLWFTGMGVPQIYQNVAPGDMYLDESNGDVWRYDGATWTKGTF